MKVSKIFSINPPKKNLDRQNSKPKKINKYILKNTDTDITEEENKKKKGSRNKYFPIWSFCLPDKVFINNGNSLNIKNFLKMAAVFKNKEFYVDYYYFVSSKGARGAHICSYPKAKGLFCLCVYPQPSPTS